MRDRGQDSTGIATMENTVFHIHKAKGQVTAIERYEEFNWKIGLGHVRYATKVQKSVEEAQPLR